MTSGKTYLYNLALAADCFVNALLAGNYQETLSSRCYRNARKGYWYAKVAEAILDLIFKPWDAHHCKESYEAALARGDCPAVDSDKE